MTQTTLTTAQQAAELIAQLSPHDQQTILKFTEFLLAAHQNARYEPTVLDKPNPTVDEILEELTQIHAAEPTEFEETVRTTRPNPLLEEEPA